MELANFLHLKGFYYGDFKPQNLLVGNDWSIKVSDFGGAIEVKNEKEKY